METNFRFETVGTGNWGKNTLNDSEIEGTVPSVTPESNEGSHRDFPSRRDPLLGVLRLSVLLLVSWVVMCTTHEFGHILGGWLSGGTLQRAELRPWKLPFSIFNPDPRPLVTLWSGPIFGSVLPVIVSLVLRRRWSCFVTWFCVLANGAYLATAWYAGGALLDTNRMFAAGASKWSVLAFIAITFMVGYPRFRRACQIEWDNEPFS
jgi:hypothetical protein